MSKLCSRVNLIIKDLQDGKEERQKELYDITFNYLKPLAVLYAEDKFEWEDILQEAYLRIFKYIHTADLEQDCYNWMCKVVQHVAYDHYKKTKPEELIDNLFSIEDLEERFLENDALHREISKLPKEEKTIIILRFWGDKTIRDIASEVDMKKSTVHKHIMEIINKLKDKLE